MLRARYTLCLYAAEQQGQEPAAEAADKKDDRCERAATPDVVLDKRGTILLGQSLLDANPLGESIRGRLGRIYDAAALERFRRSV